MISIDFQIILGSGSPRRQALLSALGIPFIVKPTGVDESFPKGMHGHEVAMMLSKRKALSFEEPQAKEIILTCDTLVWLNDEILNKPSSREEAINMLMRLSGNTHTVYSGVTLRGKNRMIVFVEKTEVTFYDISENWISNYVENSNPYDKAGGYGIQEWIGYAGISKVNGCYYNVMGLPVSRVFQELTRWPNEDK